MNWRFPSPLTLLTIALSSLLHAGIIGGLRHSHSSRSESTVTINWVEARPSSGFRDIGGFRNSQETRVYPPKLRIHRPDHSPTESTSGLSEIDSPQAVGTMPVNAVSINPESQGARFHIGENKAALGARAQGYLEQLIQEIERRKIYPETARRRGEGGIVEVVLTLSKHGEIETIELAHSSSNPQLDRAALETIKSLPPLGSVPDEWSKGSLTLVIPFHFKSR